MKAFRLRTDLIIFSRTFFWLLMWSVIPGSIMVVSCLYMCICSKLVFTGDDGHMRIICCGKAVTGKSINKYINA